MTEEIWSDQAKSDPDELSILPVFGLDAIDPLPDVIRAGYLPKILKDFGKIW